ncbi:MAG: DUF6128 domain-containing protein [Clostridium sp.]|nr:DUF6128 domain-containing protein [Clostridium sp.]
MQSYKRKITYFNQFHNGNVGATAGFLKLEIRGDKVKIIINIQEPPGLPYSGASLYFYHEAGDHLAAIKVDEIASVNGILTYQTRRDWQQLYDTGRDLYTFDGVAVVYNDAHYYIGDFKDRNRKDYQLVCKESRKPSVVEAAGLFEKMGNTGVRRRFAMEAAQDGAVAPVLIGEGTGKTAVQRQMDDSAEKQVERETGNRDLEDAGQKEADERPEELERKEEYGSVGTTVTDSENDKPETTENQAADDVYSKCENCPYQQKHKALKEERDTFEKMLSEYPKLPIYGATELFQCVRIQPRDIGKLDMRNWKLGVNSFLTHGFYTYQYLLLGKMRFDDGSERPIIGVPGVFSNREKYLANMFGFEQFIPVKKTGVKTGEFGYWIVEVNQEL